MPTPNPPSAIWGMVVAGAVTTAFAVDPPIIQDAKFRANQSYFSYVDSQIRGLETHVVQSLVSGLNATWVRVDGSSAAVAAGTVVCLAGSTSGTVTVATTTPLAAAGMALGVCLQAAPPGGLVPIALKGVVPPSITGIPTSGANLYARVNVSTGAIQTVSSLGASDYILGTVDAAGNLTLTPQLGASALGAGGGGGGITFANDLAGSTPTAQWLAAISGPGGVGTAQLPVHTVGFQFDASQATPTYSQATQTSSVASNNLVFTAQGPFSSSWAPGSVVLGVAAPASGGTSHGGFIFEEGGAAIFRLDAGTAKNGPTDPLVAFWMGPASASPSSTNWLFAWDQVNSIMSFAAPATTSGSIEMASAGTVQIFNGSTAGSSNIQLIAGDCSTAPVYVTIGADLTGGIGMALGAAAITGNRHISVLNESSSANVTPTNIPTGDFVTYVANASTNPSSAPTSGALLYANGGALYVYQSDGTNFKIGSGSGGSVTWANDLINSTNTDQYVSGLSGSASGGAVTIASNAWIAVANNANQNILKAGTQPLLQADGSNNLVLDGSSNVQIFANGNGLATMSGVTQPGMWLAAQLTSFLVGWYSNTIGGTTGASLVLQPQFSTNGNSTGGNAYVQLQAPSGSGSEAFVVVQRGGTYNGAFVATMSLGAVPGSSGLTGGIYAHGITPGATNYSLAMTSLSTVVQAPGASGSVGLYVNNVSVAILNATSVSFYQPVGGGSAAFRWQVGTQSINGSSGTFTLGVAVYSSPLIKLTSTSSPGTATVIFPNVEAEWIIDLTGMAFGGGSAILEAGSATKTVVISHTTPLMLRLICDGNSNMYSQTYT